MAEHLGYLISDTARLFRRELDVRLRGTGVTALQFRFLAELRRNPGARQSELATLLEVEPITLSRMVDRLADAELVERRTDPSDRRAWKLFVTPKAEAMHDELYALLSDLKADALGGLDQVDVETAARVIEHIRSNLSRQAGADEQEPGGLRTDG